MEHPSDNASLAVLRRLYPLLSDSELAEAQMRLDRYLAIAQRVYERHLTKPMNESTIRTKSITQ